MISTPPHGPHPTQPLPLSTPTRLPHPHTLPLHATPMKRTRKLKRSDFSSNQHFQEKVGCKTLCSISFPNRCMQIVVTTLTCWEGSDGLCRFLYRTHNRRDKLHVLDIFWRDKKEVWDSMWKMFKKQLSIFILVKFLANVLGHSNRWQTERAVDAQWLSTVGTQFVLYISFHQTYVHPQPRPPPCNMVSILGFLGVVVSMCWVVAPPTATAKI